MFATDQIRLEAKEMVMGKPEVKQNIVQAAYLLVCCNILMNFHEKYLQFKDHCLFFYYAGNTK
jgi:hypothetical protein